MLLVFEEGRADQTAQTYEYMRGRGLLVGNVPKNESLVVLCPYRRLMNLGAP